MNKIIKNNFIVIFLYFLLSLIIGIIGVSLILLAGKIFKQLVDRDWHSFLNYFFIIIGAYLGINIFQFIKNILKIKINMLICNDLRKHLIKNTKYLMKNDFELGRGRISSILFKTIPQIIEARIFGFLNMLINIITFIALTSILLFYFWGLFLIVIILATINYLFVIIISKKVKKINKKEYKYTNKHDEVSAKIMEFYNTSYFRGQHFFIGEELKKNSYSFKFNILKLNIRDTLLTYYVTILNMLSQLINASLTAVLYLTGYIPIETLVMTPFIFGMISTTLGQTFSLGVMYMSIVGIIEEVFPNNKIIKPIYKEKLIQIDEIIFKNLNFKFGDEYVYEKDKEIIFKNKNNYLITGPSGSGKTLVIRSLFEENSFMGDIIVNGKSIKEYHQRGIMDNIFLLEANPRIFDDTALNNITLFDEYSQEDIEKVLMIANLNNETLSMNAHDLSEGQKQRVSLACILIRNPKWIVIDEGLSNVDEKTANQIFKKLIALDMTLINISHSLTVERRIYDKEYNF